MYCPSCGKGIPEGSTFCLHCGSRIDSPSGVSVQVRPSQIEWDYRDFVFKWSPKQIWVSVGRQGYTMPAARAWFWQEYQREITSELQKWLDAGWEPVGEVGPSSIEVRTYKDAKLSPIGWLFVLGFSIFTLFLPLLFIWDDYAEPTAFRLQMRAPKGTKAPASSPMGIQADPLTVSTYGHEPSVYSQEIEELAKAGQFEKAAQLLEDAYNEDPSAAPKIAGFPCFELPFPQTEPVSGYALLIHLAGRARKRELALQYFRRMVELTPRKEIWKAQQAAQEAGIRKEAKDILKQQGIA